MDAEQIRLALQALRHNDLPTHGGQTLAYVYDSGLPEADAIGREALSAYASTNALDPTAFPSLLQMEQDLIGMAADLLDGPPETVGTVTSGAPSRCCSRCKPPGTRIGRSPNPTWCCRLRYTRRSTRRPTTSVSARCSSMSIMKPVVPSPRR